MEETYWEVNTGHISSFIETKFRINISNKNAVILGKSIAGLQQDIKELSDPSVKIIDYEINDTPLGNNKYVTILMYARQQYIKDFWKYLKNSFNAGIDKVFYGDGGTLFR